MELGFEVCEENKERKHCIAIGQSNHRVHLVKMAEVNLVNCELAAPAPGGNNQACQQLSESGVWYEVHQIERRKRL